MEMPMIFLFQKNISELETSSMQLDIGRTT